MDIDGRYLDEALRTLGEVLEARGLTYEIVAIGGSALMLLGLINRPTRDLDALALVEDGAYIPADPLPPLLTEGVASVGRALGLADDWLNAGPTELLRFGLPEGFEERVEWRRFGGLTLQVAGRLDQICFKLYAAVDQGVGSKHASDLQLLEPTRDELLAAARWSRTHDPSEGYREVLVATLSALGVEVGSVDV
jgi:hypothetical protein